MIIETNNLISSCGFPIQPNVDCAKILNAAYRTLEKIDPERVTKVSNRLLRKLHYLKEGRFKSAKDSALFYCAMLTFGKYLSLLRIPDGIDIVVSRITLSQYELNKLDEKQIALYHQASYALMKLQAEAGNLNGVGALRVQIPDDSADFIAKSSVEFVIAIATSGDIERATSLANALISNTQSNLSQDSIKRLKLGLATAHILQDEGKEALSLIKNIELSIQEKQDLFQPMLKNIEIMLKFTVSERNYKEAFAIAITFDRDFPFFQKSASLFLIQTLVKLNEINSSGILNNLAKPKNKSRYCYYGAYILCELMARSPLDFKNAFEVFRVCLQPDGNLRAIENLRALKNLSELKNLYKLSYKSNWKSTLNPINKESFYTLFRANILAITERCKPYQQQKIKLKIFQQMAIKGVFKGESLKKYLKTHTTNSLTATLACIEIAKERQEPKEIEILFKKTLQLI